VATFVLVSGAWHAGWCWERVVPLLEAAGHQVVAPDLLGMGGDKTPLSTVTLARWADQIADIIAGLADKVVLVGHSRGGIVISAVAERAPDRIETLVYLAAFLVPPGQTLFDVANRISREAKPGVVIAGDDGTTTIHPDAVGPAFYNRTEPAWIARAKEQLTPEPMAVFTTPLALTSDRFGSVRRAYIECAEDNAVPLELQRLMQEELPCSPVFTLESDHSPFFSSPGALVDCLQRIADER